LRERQFFYKLLEHADFGGNIKNLRFAALIVPETPKIVNDAFLSPILLTLDIADLISPTCLWPQRSRPRPEQISYRTSLSAALSKSGAPHNELSIARATSPLHVLPTTSNAMYLRFGLIPFPQTVGATLLKTRVCFSFK